MVLFVEVSHHEPSTFLSLTSPSYLLQVFTVGHKHHLSRLQKHVVWGAVFQSNILLVSWEECLKMKVVCVFRTVSTPDDFMYFWKVTVSLFFRLKWCHEMEWGWGLLWNNSFGIIISHTTFYRLKDFILEYISSSVHSVYSDNIVAIFGPVSY